MFQVYNAYLGVQLLEVGVLEGLVHGDAVLGVERKHLTQYRETRYTRHGGQARRTITCKGE